MAKTILRLICMLGWFVVVAASSEELTPIDICFLAPSGNANIIKSMQLWRAARAIFDRIHKAGNSRFAIVQAEEEDGNILLKLTDDYDAVQTVLDNFANNADDQVNLQKAIYRIKTIFDDDTRAAKKAAIFFLTNVADQFEVVAAAEALRAADVEIYVMLTSATPDFVQIAAHLLTGDDTSKIMASSNIDELEWKIASFRRSAATSPSTVTTTRTSDFNATQDHKRNTISATIDQWRPVMQWLLLVTCRAQCGVRDVDRE